MVEQPSLPFGSQLLLALRIANELVSDSEATLGERIQRRILASLKAWDLYAGGVVLGLAADDAASGGKIPTWLETITANDLHTVEKRLLLLRQSISNPEKAVGICRELDDMLRDKLAEIRSTADQLQPEYQEQLAAAHNSVYSALDQAQALDRIEGAVLAAEQSASQAADAAKNAVTASGTAGESRLSREYKKYANAEAATAHWFRIATIALIVVGIGMTVLLPHASEATLPDVTYRLAILAAVFGLAGYLSRQAHNHRVTAAWANTIRVQLETFDAFVDPLQDEAAKVRLRSEFATRVFGPNPSAGEEGGVTISSDLVKEAVAAVTKVAAK
jgi:uncharacterized protein YukE